LGRQEVFLWVRMGNWSETFALTFILIQINTLQILQRLETMILTIFLDGLIATTTKVIFMKKH